MFQNGCLFEIGHFITLNAIKQAGATALLTSQPSLRCPLPGGSSIYNYIMRFLSLSPSSSLPTAARLPCAQAERSEAASELAQATGSEGFR